MIRMNIHDAERVLCLMHGGAMKGDKQGGLNTRRRRATCSNGGFAPPVFGE